MLHCESFYKNFLNIHNISSWIVPFSTIWRELKIFIPRVLFQLTTPFKRCDWFISAMIYLFRSFRNIFLLKFTAPTYFNFYVKVNEWNILWKTEMAFLIGFATARRYCNSMFLPVGRCGSICVCISLSVRIWVACMATEINQ